MGDVSSSPGSSGKAVVELPRELDDADWEIILDPELPWTPDQRRDLELLRLNVHGVAPNVFGKHETYVYRDYRIGSITCPADIMMGLNEALDRFDLPYMVVSNCLYEEVSSLRIIRWIRKRYLLAS